MKRYLIITAVLLLVFSVYIFAAAEGEDASRFLVIRGLFNDEGELFVSPLYIVKDERFDAPDGTGPYRLELLDIDGSVLSSHNFSTDIMHIIMNDGSEREKDSGMFAFQIPLMDNARNISIKRDGVTLFESGLSDITTMEE